MGFPVSLVSLHADSDPLFQVHLRQITMSTLTTNKDLSANHQTTRVQAYVALTKLRISVMVLFTFAVAGILAAEAVGATWTLGMMASALIGMLMIAASGNAMNMYIERYSDFLMPRTAQRPLPAQRLSATEVVTFAAITFGIGVAFLFAAVNWQTALCGVANWVLYVFVYTPLKRTTPLNTEIGAVAGAMPVIMGSLATTQSVGLISWAFFGVLFLWQFPHFMAIAWMYRDQYRDGGLKMLTVTEPTGAAAGRKAIVTGVMLIFVSLLPVIGMRTPVHAVLFGLVAVVLGVYYLKAAIEFKRNTTDTVARRLLRVSLLYLPLYMLAMIIARLT